MKNKNNKDLGNLGLAKLDNNFCDSLNLTSMDNAFKMISHLEDNSGRELEAGENLVKWKGQETQVVLESDDYFYKFYERPAVLNFPFESEVRKCLCNVYNNLGLYWEIISIEHDGKILDFEKRQKLKVATKEDGTFEDLFLSFSYLLDEAEKMLELDKILTTLKKANKIFEPVQKLKLLRHSENKFDDYAVHDNQAILLDDAEFYIALVGEDNKLIDIQEDIRVTIHVSYGDFLFTRCSMLRTEGNKSFLDISPWSEHYPSWFLISEVDKDKSRWPDDGRPFLLGGNNEVDGRCQDCQNNKIEITKVQADLAPQITDPQITDPETTIIMSSRYRNMLTTIVFFENSVDGHCVYGHPKFDKSASDGEQTSNNSKDISICLCTRCCPDCNSSHCQINAYFEKFKQDNNTSFEETLIEQIKQATDSLKNFDFEGVEDIYINGPYLCDIVSGDDNVKDAFKSLIQQLGKLYIEQKIHSIHIPSKLDENTKGNLYKILDMLEEVGCDLPQPENTAGIWVETYWNFFAEEDVIYEERDEQTLTNEEVSKGSQCQVPKNKRYWEAHMDAILSYYPWVKKNTTICLTQDFCNAYVKENFNPFFLTGRYDTYLSFELPQCCLSLIENSESSASPLLEANQGDKSNNQKNITRVKQDFNNNSITNYFPERRLLLKFVSKLARTDKESFIKFLKKIPVHFIDDVTPIPCQNLLSPNESEGKTENGGLTCQCSSDEIININCLINNNSDKHAILYAIYSDSPLCALCDIKKVWDSAMQPDKEVV